MSTSLGQRIIKGVSANLISQGLSIVIQFISVPLFIGYWGVDLYGQWLLLFAVPSYLSFINLGFGVTSSAEIAKALNKDDTTKALQILQSTFFITVTLGALVSVLAAFALLFDIKGYLNISSYSSSEVNVSFLMLVFYVVLNQQMGIFTGLYNYAHKYHFITYANTFFRFAEFLGMVAVIILSKSILLVTCVILALKLIQFLFLARDIKKRFAWVRYGIKHRQFQYIKQLFLPSISLLLFPICLAILNQGITIVIGKNVGPAVLVLFNSLRTLTNAIKQFTQQYNNLMYSELVKFFAAHKVVEAKKLFNKSILATTAFTFLAGAGLLILGPWFMNFWTKGQLADVSRLFILYFIIEIITYNLFHSVYQAYQAHNGHVKLSFVYLGTSILTIVGTNVLGDKFSYSEVFLVLCSLANVLMFLFFKANALSYKADNEVFIATNTHHS